MRASRISRGHPGGYVSYAAVLLVGVVLTMMTFSAYRRASLTRDMQASTQLRADMADREEAILRAVVNVVPNRAIRAMQSGSDASSSARNALTWQTIFSDALAQANARAALDAQTMERMGIGANVLNGNPADTTTNNVTEIFDAIEPEAGVVAPGINRSLGDGWPVPLTLSDATQASRDRTYPIISTQKIHGSLASGRVGLDVNAYPLYNRIPYPSIHFGYAEPGQMFVAKRNWWAFSLNLGENDGLLNSFMRDSTNGAERDFVLSIYEVPSQLAISAETFTQLGRHGDGTEWQNATIEGGVFATRAEVDSNMHLSRIAGRRGLTLGAYTEVGNEAIQGNPFDPGVREAYEATHGTFMPVYLSSESGRSAFIPINRGTAFFDRFAHSAETNTLSATTWNNYSVGAMQCAMRLDVTAVQSSTNRTPTVLRFSYLRGGVRQTMTVDLVQNPVAGLPPGYIRCCDENQSYTFPVLVDVAYGANTRFYYKSGVIGSITFNNQTFGDPLVGTFKAGYYRPTYPFEVRNLPSGKTCIAVYPQRFPAFLAAIGGDPVTANSSLVVNVDYSTTGLNSVAYRPSIPCSESDYGVILSECSDMTAWTKGFSLVTNMRLYFGDDFNVTATSPPAGTNLPMPYVPPASLFAPEKRYGAEADPFRVQVSGQLGHLGGDGGAGTQPVRLLDFKLGSGRDAGAQNIAVNLKPIVHPADLPPIVMMNWLVVLEERKKDYYGN